MMPLTALNAQNRSKMLILGLFLLSIPVIVYFMIAQFRTEEFSWYWVFYIFMVVMGYAFLGFLADDFITAIWAKMTSRNDKPWEADDIQDRDTAILLGSQGYHNVFLPNNYIHFVKMQKQLRDVEIKMNALFDQMFTELHKLHQKSE